MKAGVVHRNGIIVIMMFRVAYERFNCVEECLWILESRVWETVLFMSVKYIVYKDF